MQGAGTTHERAGVVQVDRTAVRRAGEVGILRPKVAAGDARIRLGRYVVRVLPVAALRNVVSEALTNVAKYARASIVHVDVTRDDGILQLVVRDDGIGGAVAGAGSGLVGFAGPS